MASYSNKIRGQKLNLGCYKMGENNPFVFPVTYLARSMCLEPTLFKDYSCF